MRAVADQLCDLQKRIKQIEQAIRAWHRSNEASRRLATIPGVGSITASAIVATVANATEFKSARHFAAFLGLTPKQCSTGGRQRRSRRPPDRGLAASATPKGKAKEVMDRQSDRLPRQTRCEGMRIEREIQMATSGGGQSIKAGGIAARTGRTQTCNRHDSPKPKTPLTRGGRPHNFPPAASLVRTDFSRRFVAATEPAAHGTG